VAVDIAAPASRVWQLLTDAEGMARWNSTVTRIGGEIAAGQRLAIEVAAAPGRTFKPRVVAFEAARRMVCADGMAALFKGVRTFVLSESAPGRTRFEMDEVFSGLMLPLIRSSLPDFAPIFERYAQDLQREAEHKHAARQ
jgi:uncharacterized protein YndB with AHSA1/START domain